MPYACSYEVPADDHMYQRVRSEIGDGPADGLIAHLVVRSDHGLRHISVWESEHDWDAFRQGRVEPAVARALAAVGSDRTPPPLDQEELQVVDIVTPASLASTR